MGDRRLSEPRSRCDGGVPFNRPLFDGQHAARVQTWPIPTDGAPDRRGRRRSAPRHLEPSARDRSTSARVQARIQPGGLQMNRRRLLRLAVFLAAVQLISLAGCATGGSGSYEGSTCWIDGSRMTYPKGRREECQRTLNALTDLRRARMDSKISERAYLEGVLVILDSSDAQAALAASSTPGPLGALRTKATDQLREGRAR